MTEPKTVSLVEVLKHCRETGRGATRVSLDQQMYCTNKEINSCLDWTSETILSSRWILEPAPKEPLKWEGVTYWKNLPCCGLTVPTRREFDDFMGKMTRITIEEILE